MKKFEIFLKEESKMTVEIKINTIQEALEDLGVSVSILTDEEKRKIDEDGFIIFHNIVDAAWLEQLRNAFEELCEREGFSAGKEVHKEKGVRRLSDLMNKGEMFDRVYTHPKVLAAAYHVLGREFHLYSLNARDAKKGEGNQGLHADWAERDPEEPNHVCNAIWVLDDFTENNGATRVVPGTHRMKGLPKDYMEDTSLPHPDQVIAICPAGSIIFCNSHIWHGGTTNESGQIRRVLHNTFSGREHEQQQDQRRFIRKTTFDRISPAARYILNVD
jgi:ectoine hydroxylase-related dioxygenase (phytanoyl-CoA dioxygenase family)